MPPRVHLGHDSQLCEDVRLKGLLGEVAPTSLRDPRISWPPHPSPDRLSQHLRPPSLTGSSA